MSSHDSASFDEKVSEKDVDVAVTVAPTDHHAQHLEFKKTQVDEAAQLVLGEDYELDKEEARRIRWKIDLHILPLMFSTSQFLLINPGSTNLCLRCIVLYWIQFMDKTTLGSSAILGIKQATHLTTNQ